MDERVFQCLSEFVVTCSEQQQQQQQLDSRDQRRVFDRLTAAGVRDHLQTLMPGLTSAVLRIYHSSVALQQELFERAPVAEWTEEHDLKEKLTFYNHANREAAIRSQHMPYALSHDSSKSVPLDQSLVQVREELKALEEHLFEIRRQSEQGNEGAAVAHPQFSQDPEIVTARIAHLRSQLKDAQEEKSRANESAMKIFALGSSSARRGALSHRHLGTARGPRCS